MQSKASKLLALARRQLENGSPDLAYGMGTSGIRQYPNNPELLQLTALAAFEIGQSLEACALCEQALKLDENNHILAYNFATILLHLGRAIEARTWLEKSLKIEQDYAPAHANLGSVLIAFGELDAALAHLDRAIHLGHETCDVLINRASAFRDLGQIDAALENYLSAMKLAPNSAIARSNYLLCLNYTSRPQQVLKKEHESWGRVQHVGEPFQGKFSTGPKIRVGYVSPDFRRHSVAYFLESVLRNHDRGRFEVVCVSNTQRSDSTTERLKQCADTWIDIKGCDTKLAVQKIRDAQVHVLFDLAAHTAHNRLDVFGHRSAPIQATWLGYPNTTGLPQMDFRLGDKWTDPAGFESHYSETLVHLDNHFICFSPQQELPEIKEKPQNSDGPVTFGSFNLLAKINERVVQTWAQILARVPNSKLILKSKQLASTRAQEHYIQLFAAHGIEQERLILRSHVNSFAEHLALYNQMDIALDPFPYNGTTTTCEAFLMGVPVVCLAGERHSCRVGVSLLSAMGLDPCISHSTQDYVKQAVHLANHPQDLKEMTSGLRQRFLNSRLCDARAFTQDLEKLITGLVQGIIPRGEG